MSTSTPSLYLSSLILFGKANSTWKICAAYQNTSYATFASTRRNPRLEMGIARPSMA
jgi:hypothetical protein